MELVLQLKPEEELRLSKAALTLGMELPEYALWQLLGTETYGKVTHSHRRREGTESQTTEANPVSDDPTIALLESWLGEDATTDPEELRAAEEDLLEFKRNMNLPRKEAGARLHYPEAE